MESPDRLERVDYSLYLVTDRNLLQGRDLVQAVKDAVKGGVTVVQLREKSASTRDFYQLAVALKDTLKGTGVPLLINDRLDIALAVDADGVHIGQDDLPLAVMHQLLGNNKIIGLSVSTLNEARAGEKMGATYLGISPVFPTATKPEAANATGIDGLRNIKGNSSIPIVGIGGINEKNLREIKAVGIDGVAVVSALMCVPDIEAAARRLTKIWRNQ